MIFHSASLQVSIIKNVVSECGRNLHFQLLTIVIIIIIPVIITVFVIFNILLHLAYTGPAKAKI